MVDDAAIFPPGNAALHNATAAYGRRTPEDGSDLVGAFIVKDTLLPLMTGFGAPLAVVGTRSAADLASTARFHSTRGSHIEALEMSVRNQDNMPVDVKQTITDLAEPLDRAIVYIELPALPADAQWLAAADAVAAANLRLKFRTGGLSEAAFPTAAILAGWIDAAISRETPFKCTAGLHRAVRHTGLDGFEHHGFLNVLCATGSLASGSSVDEASAILEERDESVLLGALGRAAEVNAARKWFSSFGSCSVLEPLGDLQDLGLLT